MTDHLTEPANSAVLAHDRHFAVRASWSDGLPVVLSVSDAVDVLTAPALFLGGDLQRTLLRIHLLD